MRFGDISIPRISNAEPLKLEFQHFLDCVTQRIQPRSDGQDGLRVVRILESAQRSLDMDGVPVSLQGGSAQTISRPVGVPHRQWTPYPVISHQVTGSAM